MSVGWSMHEDKLCLMEALCCKLEDICSSNAQSTLRETTQAVCSHLQCMQRECRQIIDHLRSCRQSSGTDLRHQTSLADVDDDTIKRFVIIVTYLVQLVAFLYTLEMFLYQLLAVDM